MALPLLKGTLTALIDARGNFIIPYSKYRFNSYGFTLGVKRGKGNIMTKDFGYGLFLTLLGEVFVNSKGKVFGPTNGVGKLCKDGGYFSVSKDNQTSYYDPNFEKLGLDQLSKIITIRNGQYVNLKNEPITKKQYALIDRMAEGLVPFSEGLACVGSADQFGQVRYGFINIKGEEVIPLKFSNQPSNFSSGLAKVIPADKSEFAYAYINTKGDVVLKFTRQDMEKYGEFGDFTNNMAYSPAWISSKGHILTKERKITSINELFKALGLGQECQLLAYDGLFCQDSILRYVGSSTQRNNMGFINLTTGKVVDAKFHHSHPHPIYFDAASGLSYAQTYLGEDNQGTQIWRKGYINRDGIYMIVLAPTKSTW